MEDRKSLVCTEKENIGNCPTVKHSCLCAGRGVLASMGCFPKVSFLVCESLHIFALFLSGLLARLKKSWTKEVGAAG